MKKFLSLFFMTIVFSQVYSGELLHRILSEEEKNTTCFVWEETDLKPFDELIVSWNASRPLFGSYLIRVSLFTSEWSPWFDYAFWGARDQFTFKKDFIDSSVRVYQDAVEVLDDNKASGFRIEVLVNEEPSLDGFRALHISAIDKREHALDRSLPKNISIRLNVPGLSQIALPDERRNRFCSPASTTAVINFLKGCRGISPIDFADGVVDSAFDIYGNWILNTAQASHILGKDWQCYVVRLSSFNSIIDQLVKGYPVIVSVRGPLIGSALPYDSGHLLVVEGYDSQTEEVLCMDPAFPTDSATHATYALQDFLTAWSRRLGIAYLFNR